MKCPYCGAEESKVIDSRPTEDNERIRRRRECLNCHMRFTTYEVVETVPLVVIKKDNSREPFDRQKLLTILEHYNGYAAIGNTSEFLTSLPPVYHQARDALRLGRAKL